ncbi:MAG: RICIN domain-containing protein [Chloroflexota bacterium]|nr:RICIN domain-containing protein [Chloroflexota bacterium]
MHRFISRGALCALLGCLILATIAFQFQGGLARASGETVNVWLTTPDQANLLSPQGNLTFGSVGSNSTTITVNDAQTYQQMLGFGASLTDSSAWLIYNKMSQSQRNQLMTNLFDPNNGIGLNFLRQPMGASDLALNEYTYDDVPSGQTDPNLTSFSIAHDSAYIIPVLKQALQLNPNLKIMGTPWTAPAWMKTNGSLEQGSLNTANFQVYAQYFVNFIKAYQGQGLPIFSVSPQNEPGNNNRMPTMPMSATDEMNFIANNLGPTMASNGLSSTQIWAYDHNWDNPGYPSTILNNPTAASYVAATAWHCYAGDPTAMTAFHNSYPNKDIHETECSGGGWEGSNWPAGFKNTVELGVNSARNWARTVVRWGLALDPNGNPHVNSPDSCSNCRGVVSIDQGNGNVTYNSDYYGLGQFSKFLTPNAYRVDSNSFGGGNIEDVAFKNSDGSKVLVVYNGGGGTNTFQVVWNNEAFSYSLPAGAAVTFKWSGTGGGGSTPTPTTTGSTPTPTATPSNSGYSYIVNLHSGKALDDTNGSTSNGTIMQQWTQANGNYNQEWSLVPAGNGYYYIINRHSGLALDDTNGSTSNGTLVQQWTQINGNANQEWSLVSAGNGYDYIVNLHSSMALDDTNGSTSNGTQIQLWAQGNGNANQEWSLVQA